MPLHRPGSPGRDQPPVAAVSRRFFAILAAVLVVLIALAVAAADNSDVILFALGGLFTWQYLVVPARVLWPRATG